MKFRKNKKGFTIVELIIVIAVIGILTAVMVPTIVHLVNKANKASDEALVSNLNKAIQLRRAEPGAKAPTTMHETVEGLKPYGYNVDALVAKSEEDLVYNLKLDKFVLSDDASVSGHEKDFWRVQSRVEADQKYYANPEDEPANAKKFNIYAAEGFSFGDASAICVGFDAGSAEVSSVNYSSHDADEVVIRTNSEATTLTINGYVNPSNPKDGDVIAHYGVTGALSIIKCAIGSYHENGKVGFAEINSGRIVLEQESEIEHIHINKKDDNSFDTVEIKDNGTEKLPSSITRDEVSVAAESSVDVVKVITSTGAEETVKVYGSTATGSTQKTETQNTNVNSILGGLVLDNGASSDKALNNNAKEEVKDEYAAEATNAQHDYGDSVARIGTTGYSTLQAAIDAATGDNVVVLLKDVELSTNRTVDGVSKYAIAITKSLILNGAGHTVTGRTDRVIGIKGASQSNMADVVIKNISLIGSDHNGAQVIMTRDYLKSLTLENVYADNTAGKSGYIQAITIGGNESTKRTVTIKNSVILNRPSTYYTIILYQPADLKVYDSELAGWSTFYFKDTSAGSTLLVERSKLTSVGLSGNTNSFGMIDFETNGIPVQIKDSHIDVSTTSTGAFQAIVLFSQWQGPNNGSNVTITGGSIKLTGEMAAFVYDYGAENSVSITNCSINNNGVSSTSYSYVSPELTNLVAYMYTTLLNNVPMTVCDGYNDFNYYLAHSSEWFCDGEWFEFYSPNVTLSANANFGMVSSSIGEFGLLLGNSTLNPNGYKITILEGVTVKTDKQLTNVFAAPAGFNLVETEIEDGAYHYSYSIVAA